jgi:tetratricopeptide (TPR) repeat protein
LHIVRDEGTAAFADGDLELARADFAEYVQRKPYDGRGRYDLGRTLLALGEPAEASEHLWVAYDVNPDDEAAADALADALLQSGDTAELSRYLRDMVRNRGRVSDYLRLGYFAAKSGDPDEAHRALLTAARIDHGKSIEPQLALAEFYASIGDRENAVRRLRMALYLDPLDERVLTKLRAAGEVPGPSIGLIPEEAE